MTSASLNVQASDSIDGKIVHKMFKIYWSFTLRKKGTKAITGVVPFQKVLGTNMCTFGANMYL